MDPRIFVEKGNYMTEKRKKIFIIIIIAAVLISIGGAFIFFTHHPKTEKKEQLKKTSTLESYNSDDIKPVDDKFIDESESLSDEQQNTYKKEITALLDQYYGTMFNFDENTSDYSGTLAGYFGTSDLFKYGNKDVTQVMFKEFQGIHMKSQYLEYHILSIVNRKTEVPEVSVIGYVKAHFSNDKVEEGDYGCLNNMVLLKEDGSWKICTDQVTTVMKADTIKAYENSSYPISHALNIKGDQVMCWDPADAEGFLTDYKYGQEWPDGDEETKTYDNK